jgi:hypothetical protein
MAFRPGNGHSATGWPIALFEDLRNGRLAAPPQVGGMLRCLARTWLSALTLSSECTRDRDRVSRWDIYDRVFSPRRTSRFCSLLERVG